VIDDSRIWKETEGEAAVTRQLQFMVLHINVSEPVLDKTNANHIKPSMCSVLADITYLLISIQWIRTVDLYSPVSQ